MCLQFGDGTGKVFVGQDLAALDPFQVTLPFPQGDSVGFSRVGQHHWAMGDGHPPSLPQAASSPSPVGHEDLALPLNYTWPFLPLRSLFPESQRDQANCNYLVSMKMCHYQLSSFELKQDCSFSLFLTNINDAELDPSSPST